MPDIRAFRGILYNPQAVKDIARVVTEPYDVISPAKQEAYHQLHPQNIIHLILGRQYPGDNRRNNQYTRASRYFRQWQKENILIRDRKDNIYIYTQTFLYAGKEKTRTGFIALMKLEDFAKNSVLPHENTFSQPVQDRLKLLKTVRANLSPIFALCADKNGALNKLLSEYKKRHPPHIEFEKDQVVHRLWKMSDPRKVALIRRLLKGQQIFIADGHHRYESALNYKLDREKARQRSCISCDYNYVMTYLTAITDRGLTILPTHRALKVKNGISADRLISSLKRCLYLRNFSSSEAMFSYIQRQHPATSVFGMYLKKKFYCLTLKDSARASRLIRKSSKNPSKSLDVAVLHDYIIGELLRLSPAPGDILYTRDAQEAIHLVDRDAYQLAFFLQPPTVGEVKKVAQARERMPHKSTYFYPKLLTGLVINSLDQRGA